MPNTDSRPERPNILLITTDTQRCDTLNCMGHEHAISPNLDTLAREGVLFEEAYTSSPMCGPARSSLQTGVHTPIHQQIENGLPPRDDLTSFPELLAGHGYRNIMVGFTHDEHYDDSFDVVHRTTSKQRDTDVEDSYAKHIQEHGYPRASSHAFESDPNTVPEDLFIDSFIAETTIDEIDFTLDIGADPFFAFCSFNSPHSPFDPPGDWAHCYDDVALPPINYEKGEILDHPTMIQTLLGLDESYAEEFQSNFESEENRNEMEELRRLYYGLTSYVDHQIGKLLEYLNDAGVRENTLVIFTSDHGYELFDHGIINKHNYYDSTWRVPFIMSQPGTLPEDERRTFATWNDISRTILSAAGTDARWIQGFDLYEPLAAGNPSPRDCAVGTFYFSAAVATERWKLEYYFEEDTGRLFDRENDPVEQNDLYDDPDYRNIRNQLRHALLRWRSEISNFEFLFENSYGDSNVAGRKHDDLADKDGVDPDIRLGDRVSEI